MTVRQTPTRPADTEKMWPPNARPSGDGIFPRPGTRWFEAGYCHWQSATNFLIRSEHRRDHFVFTYATDFVARGLIGCDRGRGNSLVGVRARRRAFASDNRGAARDARRGECRVPQRLRE